MASDTSEFNYPNLMQYHLTLYAGDYEMTGTYGEPPTSSREEFWFFHSCPVSSADEGEVYQTDRPRDEYTTWFGIGSFFDRYWRDDQFPHGAGLDTSNYPHDTELVEKAEAAYLVEEHSGGSNYCYDDEVEMQRGCDYLSWNGDEYGSEEYFHDYGNTDYGSEEYFHDYGNTDGVDTGYSYGWDERKLCESIFGYLPCLADQNQESHVEENFASDLGTPMLNF